MKSNQTFRSEEMTEKLAFRVTPADIESVTAAARKKGMSKSLLIRYALADAGLIVI